MTQRPSPAAARALAAMTERAVNAVLRLDPEGASALAALTGRSVAVEVDGLGLRLLIRPQPDVVRIEVSYAEADVTIGGSAFALLGMVTARDAVTDGLPADVRATGDVAVAQALSRAAARLDIDWEECLAQAFGD